MDLILIANLLISGFSIEMFTPFLFMCLLTSCGVSLSACHLCCIYPFYVFVPLSPLACIFAYLKNEEWCFLLFVVLSVTVLLVHTSSILFPQLISLEPLSCSASVLFRARALQWLASECVLPSLCGEDWCPVLLS